MRQFEIRWAALPEPVGPRPVLLLSRTAAYQYLTKVIVAEVTTTKRAISQEVNLGRREGVPHPCVANLDNIHVVAKEALGKRIGVVAPNRWREVKRALGHALDWLELKAL